jgi:2'-5' RNA ligase
MRDHWWWRPGWRIGRRAYTFHITFEDDAAVDGVANLHRFASDYQRGLAGRSELDLVPLRWLHLTMQNVGFTDDVSEPDVHAVLTIAQELCGELAPFDLTFDAVEVRGEGIAVRPAPAEPVSQVREAVRTAIGTLRGTVPEAPEHAHGFEPHVSLAYSNRVAPQDPLIDIIESVDAAPAVVTVRAARLIVLDREERVYQWQTYGKVPLGRVG